VPGGYGPGVRVLVTGGAGFIGSAIVRALLLAGHEPVVVDLHGDAARAPGGVELVHGDVRDVGTVERVLRGVDAVSHQAAKVGLGVDLDDLPDYAGHNDVGTAALLAGMARAGVRRLVLAGSMVVYGEGRYACQEHGDQPAPPRARADLESGRFEPRCPVCQAGMAPGLVSEDARPDPRNGYAVSKLAQELLAAVWARETGGRLTVLRYHNVYGPGLPRDTPYAGVAAVFSSTLARGRAPRVFEDGGQRRDFVHVDDVAQANVLALTGDVAGTFNVGSGEQRTILDLARALADTAGGPAPVVTGEFRLGDVRHVIAATARIRAELGWSPVVPFDAGIRRLAGELIPAGR
jgi:dTDP-L-rhamnose 4-epimerase